jgi:hypothetical protein
LGLFRYSGIRLPVIRCYRRGTYFFKVAAGIRAGLFTFDCAGCDENARKDWGCYDPVDIAVWEDDFDAFYNCPYRFIAPCVIDFLDRYAAIKDGWARPMSFDEYPNRYLQYVKIFESEMSKALTIKNKGAKHG